MSSQLLSPFESDPNARFSWIWRYKLYHIPFWALYHFWWWAVGMRNPVETLELLLSSPLAIKYLSYVILQAVGVYFNLYFLIPRLLEKGLYVRYLLFLGLTIIGTAFCIIPGYYLVAWISDKSFLDLFHQAPGNFMYFFWANSLPSTIAVTTLAMSIKLTRTWLQSRRRQQELEKEKLETELKFLRSQFNPHFLFNTINSIFFLIHKNPDQASEALAKFSDLLRYQLYECNAAQIPLQTEVSFLQNFLQLEKLRHNENVSVRLNCPEQIPMYLGIAPFVLMTFLENAFKHVSKHSDQANWIQMEIEVQGNSLIVRVQNSFSDFAQKEAISYGGIGLQNVQRRLDLMYPDQYQLDIAANEGLFTVDLQLQLDTLTDIHPNQAAILV